MDDNLKGDPGRLRQVLVNLINNAVKFTEKGEIVADVSVDSRSDEGLRLRFSVSDTGVGIPPGRQTAIFDAFTQADASTTREYGGTGLGLAISRRFCELLGGSLNAASEPGKGSTFTMRIPVILSGAKPQGPPGEGL